MLQELATPMADWTPEEVAIILDDYFQMLALEIKGQSFVKAQHIRTLQSIINRTEKSIEFKYRNISAVLRVFGIPYIKGLKPADHIQKSLLPQMTRQYINNHPDLQILF